MAGARGGYALVLGGVTIADGKRFLPVFPVAIFKLDGDRRSDRQAVTHAGEDMRGVALDLHASAPAIALLAAPEFTVEEGLVDFQSSRHAGKEGDKGFAVRFSGCEVAQHERTIVPDGRRWPLMYPDQIGPKKWQAEGFSCLRGPQDVTIEGTSDAHDSGLKPRPAPSCEKLWPLYSKKTRRKLCTPRHSPKDLITNEFGV